MNRKWSTAVILFLLLILMGYIVIDVAKKHKATNVSTTVTENLVNPDKWKIDRIFDPALGQLEAVTVSENGTIFLGGESFIACFSPEFSLKWKYDSGMPVTALSLFGNDLYAAVDGSILTFDMDGNKTDEWGPFESNAMITSLSASKDYVAFADAANLEVFVLDRTGMLKSIIGKSDEPFVVPSPYFDIALDSTGFIYVANTGKRRIEKRNIEGTLISYFGEPGINPGEFSGCCNPAHIALIPGGFVTAEKGINRIEILNNTGEFVEFVSSVNNFVPPLPLDISSPGGKIIYGANPADSKLYVFVRG